MLMLMRGFIIRWVVLVFKGFVIELVMRLSFFFFNTRRRHYLRLPERYLPNGLLGRDA